MNLNFRQLRALYLQVQHQAGSVAVALATLSDARDLQGKLIKRLQVEGTSTIAARSVAASIARQMSEHAATQGNTQEAIKLCREALTHKPDDTESLDAEWGRQAICSMVEICLNPDSTAGAALESPEPDSRDSREAALKTAERLLAELKPRPVSEERNIYRLLCCFLALARREKQAAESALQELTMLAGCVSYAGVTLALATAYLVLKQATRARNQLKRVSKQVWSFEEAEYLERCWLLLAELYIQTGKYDVASELLRRALQHNKSCARAYELLGLITEKEQLHREAASNYEQAWTHGGRSNPATGYKLAFNLLKAKRGTLL
ncbi:hypothetical protein B566_EDAN015301 [Ephemera danica]|nr:hypothetical protein B566_EDAN015301 [Ephemera danica]